MQRKDNVLDSIYIFYAGLLICKCKVKYIYVYDTVYIV